LVRNVLVVTAIALGLAAQFVVVPAVQAEGPLDKLGKDVKSVTNNVTEPATKTIQKGTHPVTQAVQKTAEPLTQTEQNATTPADTTDGATAAVVEVAAPVSETVANAAKPAGQAAEAVTAPLIDSAKPATQPAVDTITNVTQPLTETVVNVTQPVVDSIGSVTQPVAGVVTPVIESAVEIVAPVVDPIVESVAPLLEPIAGPTIPVVAPIIAPIVDVLPPVTGPSGDILTSTGPVAPPFSPGGSALSDTGYSATDNRHGHTSRTSALTELVPSGQPVATGNAPLAAQNRNPRAESAPSASLTSAPARAGDLERASAATRGSPFRAVSQRFTSGGSHGSERFDSPVASLPLILAPLAALCLYLRFAATEASPRTWQSRPVTPPI
jgi:hypothetical protein